MNKYFLIKLTRATFSYIKTNGLSIIAILVSIYAIYATTIVEGVIDIVKGQQSTLAKLDQTNLKLTTSIDILSAELQEVRKSNILLNDQINETSLINDAILEESRQENRRNKIKMRSREYEIRHKLRDLEQHLARARHRWLVLEQFDKEATEYIKTTTWLLSDLLAHEKIASHDSLFLALDMFYEQNRSTLAGLNQKHLGSRLLSGDTLDYNMRYIFFGNSRRNIIAEYQVYCAAAYDLITNLTGFKKLISERSSLHGLLNPRKERFFMPSYGWYHEVRDSLLQDSVSQVIPYR